MPVKGLNDLKEENDDEERQAYYAGGQGQNGGGSGQEVLDPRDFMKRARDEMGAQTVGEWQEGQGPPPSSAFTGAGQTLSGSSVQGGSVPKPPQMHTITFYKDGFTVDDGPLRKGGDSPEDQAFLAAVNSGRMPDELKTEEGGDADVNIIDKTGEDYKPPPDTLKPFGGAGRSMRDEAAASGAGSAGGAAAPAEAQELTLDPAAPTTTLQVRMADGSRKIVKANHGHTILQLRNHIATFTPGGPNFTLKGGFPPKPLEDVSLTLADAKLLNETIVQSTI
jgi:hypothetical protein